MYISNIKLWNFRKFGSDQEIITGKKPDLNLDLTEGLNIIIGENDSGKTAIIDAIKIVLKTHSYEYIRIEDRDFYGDSAHLKIELIFKGLKPEEAKNFTEWLGWSGNGDNGVPYLRLMYSVIRANKKILPADVKAGVDEQGFALNAEARDYLKATYLKPLRDAEGELIAKRNSRLSQILLGDPAFKVSGNDHELVGIFTGLREELKKYFKGEFRTELTNEHGTPEEFFPEGGKLIKKKIDGYVKSFYGDDFETSFDAAPNDLKGILEMLSLKLLDEQHPGLGTLNRLFMAAELLHLNKENWTGVRLGLIEELEAHLHPQAQMQIIEALQKQTNIQLILTSHSPNLASKVKLENIIFCDGKNAFPMGSVYTKLRETDYPFLERFLDVTKANLFFAKGVLLIEGAAEEMIVPAIAKKMLELGLSKCDLTAGKVSVVAINNTAFTRYANIFKRKFSPIMSIPVGIINDLDLRPAEYAAKYGIISKNLEKERIITAFDVAVVKQVRTSALDGDNVRSFLSDHWTLEYCIALHPVLRKILYKSICYAIEEERADNYAGTNPNKRVRKKLPDYKINRSWDSFINGKSKEQVAFDLMYYFITDKKKISKAVIAQYFSLFLLEDKTIVAQDLNSSENSIAYIINAIKHALGH
jgi:putative ATP-dependent endonuclease of OLD family